jgi:pyrroloquinoline quinone (PQQ) biosynthesis protein C
MTTTIRDQSDALAPDSFIAEIESLRNEHRKKYPYRVREISSRDQINGLAEAKRRQHAGGDINHRFEGERYLNCSDKATRRFQLRKLVDEGGQDTVGGPQVSHPLLSRWESYGYGLTPEDITELEKSDANARELVARGWWISLMRDSHFAVAIGSGMVAEGENKIHSPELLAAIERDRTRFQEWGIADVDRALMNRHEHAGIDIDHADFNENVVRRFVTTPELQEEMKRAFAIRLQMVSGA